MEKETKIVLGVVALGVVGYYLLNKSKKVVAKKAEEKAKTVDTQVKRECPSGFEWKTVNCVVAPCPSACMQIQPELTEKDKLNASKPIFVTADKYVPILDVPQMIISPYDAIRMRKQSQGFFTVMDGSFV